MDKNNYSELLKQKLIHTETEKFGISRYVIDEFIKILEERQKDFNERDVLEAGNAR